MEPKIHKIQVLVIGGGLARCWAALRAAQMGVQVTLVDKAQVARSGASTFAAGVMLAPQRDDDLEVWQRELVEAGEYLNDQNWVRVMLEEQVERIADMQRWGLPFEKEPNGQLARRVGRGHRTTQIFLYLCADDCPTGAILNDIIVATLREFVFY